VSRLSASSTWTRTRYVPGTTPGIRKDKFGDGGGGDDGGLAREIRDIAGKVYALAFEAGGLVSGRS
jgi:hypothetical protein